MRRAHAWILSLALVGCGEDPPPPCEAPPEPADAPFEDATATSGIAFEHHFATDFCELGDTVGGPGVCLIDHDGDGDLDIYFPDRAPFANQLYENDGSARFAEVGEGAGVASTSDSMGCLAFDYDGDGDQDLYVTNIGPDQLFRNDGGTFTDVSDASGVATVDGFSQSASAGDVDGDGDLDLYVARLVDLATCPEGCFLFPLACEAQDNALLINDGGTFQNRAMGSGLTHADPSLVALIYDVDGDGDQDIYAGNDMGIMFPDRLYENDGSGFFTDRAVDHGLDAPGTDTMGFDVGDHDGDGLLDAIATDFKDRPIRLFHCFDPDFPCSNDVLPDGVDFVKWSVGFVDFDQDRDLDVFTANGDVAFLDGNPNHFYVNDGTGRYEEYEAPSGDALAVSQVGRGAAFGDLDGDGDVDIIVANAGEAPQLLLNQGALGHHLTISLDSLAVGASVRVATDRGALTELALVGGAYGGNNDPRLHFGLGPSCRADVTVRYPDGQVVERAGVDAGFVSIDR